MKTKVLIILIILFWTLPLLAQEVDTAWVRTYNGPGDTADYAWALAVDGSGNVYVTGRSNGGSGIGDDYATIKYYPNGDTAWVRRYDGPGNYIDWAFDMAVDDSGNAYVTGRSHGSGTSSDWATIKYYSNGDTAWVRRYNGPENDWDVANAIVVDDSGNVYVTGYSHFSSWPNRDYATIKYCPNGDTAWVRSYNGPGDSLDYANDIAVDDSGNVYVTGTSYGSGTERDYATIKYYPNGDTAWVRRYNGSGDSVDIAYAIAVDDLGNVCVTGYSYGSGTSRDYATIKYAPDGTELWTQTYNWSGDSPDVARTLAVDDSRNVYVTGLSGTIKYDAGGNELWIGPWGGVDIALDTSDNIYVTGVNLAYVTLKYCPNGDTAWVTAYGDLSLDAANAIAVDGSGNVYVTGYSWANGTYDDYATIKYYQINRPPDPFSLLFPPNKAFTPRGVRLDWETVTDPNACDEIKYDLYVSTSYHSFLDSATVDSNLVASEHTKTLDYGTYYWKVVAKDNFGAERESDQIRYFMVTGIHASLGDFNGDGSIDIADVLFLINYLYISGPAPDPLELGDINCDDEVNIGDVMFLINFLFKNGPSPSC